MYIGYIRLSFKNTYQPYYTRDLSQASDVIEIESE